MVNGSPLHQHLSMPSEKLLGFLNSIENSISGHRMPPIFTRFIPDFTGSGSLSTNK